MKTLSNLGQYLGQQAAEKGVDFITDLPAEPITIRGLEARLAQVFVNLITNAISFCEDGDAVRVWARRRDNRVLVVVEDTGPGIPEQALTKVFKRFYSERPSGAFRQPFGSWPGDLEADRRGAWRRDLGREHPPHRRRRDIRALGRALRGRPAGLMARA